MTNPADREALVERMCEAYWDQAASYAGKSSYIAASLVRMRAALAVVEAEQGTLCMCRHPQSSHRLRTFGDIVPLPHCDECCTVDKDGDRHHDRCFDCAGWNREREAPERPYGD